MKLWRISNYADLRGIGGIKTSARWHNRGIPVVYMAESPALAMLEVLVHLELDVDEVPKSYQLLEVEYAQRAGVSRLSSKALSKDWREDFELTRLIGDEWLTSGSSVLLKVPSALVPNSFNYLFNPRHTLSEKASILSAKKHPYDSRFVD